VGGENGGPAPQKRGLGGAVIFETGGFKKGAAQKKAAGGGVDTFSPPGNVRF